MRWRADIFGGAGEWARRLTLATAIGLFFGLVGPFGTYLRTDVAVRIVYWIGASWLATTLFGLIVAPAAVLGPRLGLPRMFSALAATAVAAIPLAAITSAAATRLWPITRAQPPLAWYGEALMISLPVVAAYTLWLRSGVSVNAHANCAAGGDPSPRRLPARLGRELLCLQMEDHYVRVHTPAGSTLLLMPLKEAIAELNGTPGLRVHRSWWVARTAVDRPLSDGRNLKLRLVNGLEVPVARASVAEVRAAGWLD